MDYNGSAREALTRPVPSRKLGNLLRKPDSFRVGLPLGRHGSIAPMAPTIEGSWISRRDKETSWHG